jgi:hypothetical protein
MITSPFGYVFMARVLLAIGVPIAGLGLFFLPDQGVVTEVLMFAFLTYFALLISAMAFPWHRQEEILRFLVVAILIVAAVRTYAAGEWYLPLLLVAAAIGLFAVKLAQSTDQIRHFARRYGTTSFANIAVEESRKRRRTDWKSDDRQRPERIA